MIFDIYSVVKVDNEEIKSFNFIIVDKAKNIEIFLPTKKQTLKIELYFKDLKKKPIAKMEVVGTPYYFWYYLEEIKKPVYELTITFYKKNDLKRKAVLIEAEYKKFMEDFEARGEIILNKLFE